MKLFVKKIIVDENFRHTLNRASMADAQQPGIRAGQRGNDGALENARQLQRTRPQRVNEAGSKANAAANGEAIDIHRSGQVGKAVDQRIDGGGNDLGRRAFALRGRREQRRAPNRAAEAFAAEPCERRTGGDGFQAAAPAAPAEMPSGSERVCPTWPASPVAPVCSRPSIDKAAANAGGNGEKGEIAKTLAGANVNSAQAAACASLTTSGGMPKALFERRRASG